MGLQSLLRHRNPGVGQKAEQVIMSMIPGGPPTSPEAAALARAFNPFLAPLPRRRRKKQTAKDHFQIAMAAARQESRASKSPLPRGSQEH